MLLVVTSTHRKHTMLKKVQKYRAAAPVGLHDRTWPDAMLTHVPIWLSESTNPTDAEQS